MCCYFSIKNMKNIVNYISVKLEKSKNTRQSIKNECLFEIMSYLLFCYINAII